MSDRISSYIKPSDVFNRGFESRSDGVESDTRTNAMPLTPEESDKVIRSMTIDQFAQVSFLMQTRKRRDLVRKAVFRWFNVATGDLVDRIIAAIPNHKDFKEIDRLAAQYIMNDQSDTDAFPYWKRSMTFADVNWLFAVEGNDVYIVRPEPPRFCVKMSKDADGQKASDGRGIMAAWFIDQIDDDRHGKSAKDSAMVAYERWVQKSRTS